MRISDEYASLQLAREPGRMRELLAPEHLTTARFETVYREMSGYGMLDLVFEADEKVFVAHAIGVDVVVLASREGPALIWPASLGVVSDVADAVEEVVTPWLLTLTRGRGMAGEYVRRYRPSTVFERARSERFYGAAATSETLPQLAPFVYARRFARNRDVYVGCRDSALAAAVIGTVARSIVLTEPLDEFAGQWYGLPSKSGPGAQPEVAVVDSLDDVYPAGAVYIVATRPDPVATTIVVPTPVANDHLFTFDPADAPAVRTFAVRAQDVVPRDRRASEIPVAFGGSGGRVALVVRDDAFVADDADTDAIRELERRLQAEGLDVFAVSASDPSIRDANIVHIFGGIEDKHVFATMELAQREGLPYLVTLEPLAPYAAYYEDGSIAALRLGADEVDEQRYLRLFHTRRLRFDSIPHERSLEMSEQTDRMFESAARGAMGIILAGCDDVADACTRFPKLDPGRIRSGATLLAAEPAEAAVAELLPAQPFLLVHAPITRRSALGHLLASLGETDLAVVIAGPISEVDVGFSLRRIAGSGVVFLPDPTPGQVAALYRRAHAIAFPALRPTGIARLLRGVLCGALPLVPADSPLARVVPSALTFDPWSRSATVDAVQFAMSGSGASNVLLPELCRTFAAHADQRAAFNAAIEVYARAAEATPR